MTDFNPTKELREAGVPVDKLPEAQREVLNTLSPEEVATITRIRERMQNDVQGYAAAEDGGGDVGWLIF